MNRQGGCLCRNIRYSLNTEPMATVICHCKNCQKQNGAAFSINFILMADQIDVSGNMASYLDQSDTGEPVHRKFCNNCGSPVLSEITSIPNLIALKVGTLDDTSGIKPQFQVWCSSQHDWLKLNAEIPAFPKNKS